MKKAISVLLVLIMAFSIMPFALAEETALPADTVQADVATVEEGTSVIMEEPASTTTAEATTVVETGAVAATAEESVSSAETQAEVQVMNTAHGAEVRLLQLEKAITKNIARGNEIIAKVKETGKDATELESIVAEMEALKVQVQAADPAAEDAVQKFVELKADAIDLSKKFRDKANSILTVTDAKALREKLKAAKDNSEVQEVERKIKEKKHEYNAERVAKMFEILGITGQEALLEKVKAGTATEKEINDAVKARVQSMTKEEKKEAYSKMKEEGVKKAVAAKAKIEKVKMTYIERKETRLNERLAKLADLGKKDSSLAKYTEQRLADLEKARVRFEERIQDREEQRERIKNPEPTETPEADEVNETE